MGGGGFGGGGIRSFSMPRTVYHPPPVFHHPAPVYHHPAPVHHQPMHSTTVVHAAPTAVFVPVAMTSSSTQTATTDSRSSGSEENSSGNGSNSCSDSSYVSTETAESHSKRENNAEIPSAPPFDSVPLNNTGSNSIGTEFIHPPYSMPTTFASSPSYSSSSFAETMYADDGCCEPVCLSRLFCALALLFATIMTISVAASRYSTAVEVADFEQVLAAPSTTWRALIHVAPGDARTESFLLAKMPLTKRNDVPRFEQQNLFVQSDSYRYAAYRLLQGSRVSMAYSTKGSFAPDFYMIESESLFQKWEDGTKVDAVSIGASRTGSITHTVAKDVEELYFVWEAARQPGNDVYANFTLDLMQYDSAANRVRSCTGTCDFALEYASNQVVLVVPFETGDQNHVQTVTYSVSPRYGPFAAVGASVSLFFMLVALGFYVQRLLRVRAWKKEREQEKAEEGKKRAAFAAETTPGITLGSIVYPPDINKI